MEVEAEDFDVFLEDGGAFFFCLVDTPREHTEVGALTWAGDGGVGEEVTSLLFSLLTPSSVFSFSIPSPVCTHMMQTEQRYGITDAVPVRTGVGMVVIKRLA